MLYVLTHTKIGPHVPVLLRTYMYCVRIRVLNPTVTREIGSLSSPYKTVQ